MYDTVITLAFIAGALCLLLLCITLILWVCAKLAKRPTAKQKRASLGFLIGFIVCFVVMMFTPTEIVQPVQSAESAAATQVESKSQSQVTVSSESSSVSVVSSSIASSKAESVSVSIGEVEVVSDNISSNLWAMGFTEDEAAEIKEIFLKCGIDNLNGYKKSGEDMTIDNLASYRIKNDNGILVFTFDHRKLIYILFRGNELYDTSKGGYLMSADDVHIPETEVSGKDKLKLQQLAEEVLDKHYGQYDVRYYDAWAVGREDDNYMVQCQVSDGSVLSDKWTLTQVYFERSADGEFTLTDIVIGGEHYTK